MKRFLPIAALLLLFSAVGAEEPENLVVNGKFQTGSHPFPPYWVFRNQGGGKVEYFKDGGPGNLPFFRLTDPGIAKPGSGYTVPYITGRGAVHLVQSNLKLMKGGKYRLGAWFRTKDLKGKYSGIRIGNGTFPVLEGRSTKGDNAIVGLPENLPEWTRIEKEVTVKSDEKRNYPYYNLVMLVEIEGGTMDVADVTLTPVDDITRRNSKSTIDHMHPGLIPLNHLQYISPKSPKIDFFWVGAFPDDPQSVICEFELDKTKKKVTVPFRREIFTVDLTGAVKKGFNFLDFRVIRKTDGKVLFSDRYRIRVIPIPAPAKAVRKNNMVTELFSGEVKDGFKFAAVNPRMGWLYFQFVPADAKAACRIDLDGKTLIDEKTLYMEAFRELEPGKYQVTHQGGAGKLIIRLVPDIMTYALTTPRGAGNGRYNWDFCKKYWIRALTTLNRGSMTEQERKEFRSMGRRFLGAFSVKSRQEDITDETAMLARFKDKLDLKNDLYDGVAMDEVEGWYPPVLDTYAHTIRRIGNPQNKTIMTYMSGPLMPSFARSFSAAVNAPGNRNWVAFEIYHRVVASEERARNELHESSLFWGLLRSSFHDLSYYAGPAFGNFCNHPSISLHNYPQVDYKYFLDMCIHLTATDPNFDGLRKIGFWGTYAADEEIARWSFQLLRHYAVEGNTDMLSKRYGYKYISGHLQNGDFSEGLKHWTSSEGVTLESYPGYGEKNLVIHDAYWPGTGDRFALFAKTGDNPAKLSQTVKNLEKGKFYCLKFYTADYLKIISDKPAVEALPLDFSMSGVKIIRDFLYKGNTPSGRLKNSGRPNFRKVIFQAESDRAELTFSNAAAPKGSLLFVNQISVHPYFASDEIR